jgi:hypothetical protein
MAWHNSREADRREAYILKQLRGLDQWQGNVVHEGLEHFFVPSLKPGPAITCDELVERTCSLAREQFQFSEKQIYKQDGTTKSGSGRTFLALREHEYGIPVSEADLQGVFDTINRCYQVLYSQERFMSFLLSGEWYEPEGLLNVHVDGVSISAKLDLVMGYRRTKLCIVDWKIGESQTADYSRQLRIYALVALKRWPRYRVTDLLLVEANLLQGKLLKHSVREEELTEIRDFIYTSWAAIQALAGDHKYDSQEIADYGYANSPFSCEYCNFERLCVRLSS